MLAAIGSVVLVIGAIAYSLHCLCPALPAPCPCSEDLGLSELAVLTGSTFLIIGIYYTLARSRRDESERNQV